MAGLQLSLKRQKTQIRERFMFHIPTVEEWWHLTAHYKQFRTPSNLTLKEYGYMKLFKLIEDRMPKRILEYGHGFSSILFEYCKNRDIEIWGVDDHMDLAYFPPKDEWRARHANELVNQYTDSKFILGQIGTNLSTRQELPQEYFDLVCSVSVLEEIGDGNIITTIASHARELLTPEGVFANTHDIRYEDHLRAQFYRNCLIEAGFDTKAPTAEERIFDEMSQYVPINKVLLENPTQAMVCYNIGDEDRIYTGHWSTLFSVNAPL
jgi:hypothetical protein